MDKNKVIEYIMHTPYNTNKAILADLLGAGDWTNLYNYVFKTPNSMNRMVLDTIISNSGASPIVGVAIVGTAIIK